MGEFWIWDKRLWNSQYHSQSFSNLFLQAPIPGHHAVAHPNKHCIHSGLLSYGQLHLKNRLRARSLGHTWEEDCSHDICQEINLSSAAVWKAASNSANSLETIKASKQPWQESQQQLSQDVQKSIRYPSQMFPNSNEPIYSIFMTFCKRPS